LSGVCKLDAFARYAFKMVQIHRLYVVFEQVVHQGMCQGMLGFHLGRKKNGQFCFGRFFCPKNCLDRGLAFCQRSGFVQDNAVDFTHIFECKCVFDQDMILCAFAHPNHQGCGGSKPKCTGAGNYEDRDGG